LQPALTLVQPVTGFHVASVHSIFDLSAIARLLYGRFANRPYAIEFPFDGGRFCFNGERFCPDARDQ
jgi:hypothetical protein